MDTSILVATITASGSVLVAALTFFLTRKNQLKSEWQHEKLKHYKVLLSSLSDLAVDGTDKRQANIRLSREVNTIALVASQKVIAALMAFHDEAKFSNSKWSVDRHDKLFKELLLAIRKDIGLAVSDDPATFKFHLIGKSASE